MSFFNRLKTPRKTFISDIVSGLVMSIVTVPGALANGLLAGVNPVYGVYSVIAGTSVAALFTSSVIMNVDSTGATAIATGDFLGGRAARPASGLHGRAWPARRRLHADLRPAQARLPGAFYLQRGHDRLSQRPGRVDHHGTMGRPDRLLQRRRQQGLQDGRHRPQRSGLRLADHGAGADHHRSARGAGPHPLGALLVCRCRGRGHDPGLPALLRLGATGRRHDRSSPVVCPCPTCPIFR